MLFETPINLNLEDANVMYYPSFFSKIDSDDFFNRLFHEINWKQDDITVYGKTYLQPRLTAFFANNNTSYKYSNLVMTPSPYNQTLLQIKNKIEKQQNIKFTSCLANLYRDGKDSNGWHADNEKSLGNDPIIASISFGSDRMFQLKHKHKKHLKTKLVLQHGSLLIMKDKTQQYWLHQIPKTAKTIGKRINLTFRIIA